MAAYDDVAYARRGKIHIETEEKTQRRVHGRLTPRAPCPRRDDTTYAGHAGEEIPPTACYMTA